MKTKNFSKTNINSKKHINCKLLYKHMGYNEIRSYIEHLNPMMWIYLFKLFKNLNTSKIFNYFRCEKSWPYGDINPFRNIEIYLKRIIIGTINEN